LTGALWMQPSLVVSPAAAGARLDAWLKTAKFQLVQIGGGTEETLRFCIEKHKPYKLIDAEEISAKRAAFLLVSFVQHYGIGVLNVAGPRQSQAPHAHAYAYAVINVLLKEWAALQATR
jgi:hypothetical protein